MRALASLGCCAIAVNRCARVLSMRLGLRAGRCVTRVRRPGISCVFRVPWATHVYAVPATMSYHGDEPLIGMPMSVSSASFARWSVLVRAVCVACLVAVLAGCGVNQIPKDEQAVNAAWAQVQNEYQRRADLVPNLVSTVKGYASHERETLQSVIEARSRATSINVDASTLNQPEQMQRFIAAQDQLTGALSHLLAVSERYPQLRSSQNFLTLQSQLEGTENRIAVARRDYIQAVQTYNTELVTFPGRFWHWLMYSDKKPHANFRATTQGAAEAPQVQF